MKIYAKIRKNGEYHSQNISHAVFGFREMGAEIVKYEVKGSGAGLCSMMNWWILDHTRAIIITVMIQK